MVYIDKKADILYNLINCLNIKRIKLFKLTVREVFDDEVAYRQFPLFAQGINT